MIATADINFGPAPGGCARAGFDSRLVHGGALMPEHWTFLLKKAEEILRRHGADVEDDRDYLIATWFVSEEAEAKKAITVVIGADAPAPPPSIVEIDIHTIYYAASVPRLRLFAAAFVACVAALDEIEQLARRNAEPRT